MSRALFRAKRGYLHSPVDDLESFFWVAVWSAFFNKGSTKGYSDEENGIRDDLFGRRKNDAMADVLNLKPQGSHSDIIHRFQPTLREWWMKVRHRDEVWFEQVLSGEPDGADGSYYLPHFHRFALEGVVDVLEVLEKHWNDELSWESWTAPTPLE